MRMADGSVIRRALKWLCLAFVVGCLGLPSEADDWLRFRGPNGSGISAEARQPALEFGTEKNLRWSIDLPGPGHSSPIVVGDRVFLTLWTGYGSYGNISVAQGTLERHLFCIDRKDGQVLWSRTVSAVLPEENYTGNFTEHGYASSTPTSDGERVYVFYGKSGVHCYDMEGERIWQQSVGSQLDQRHWGSAASPILYKDLLIVTASAEDQALVALNKTTGEVVWKFNAALLNGVWGTPVLSRVDDERTDLIVNVPSEVWGLNPETGKLRWFCRGVTADACTTSPVVDGDVIYVMDGRGGEALAIHGGGRGQVDESHVVWAGNHRGRVSTALVSGDRLFWFHNRRAMCADAGTGLSVFEERLPTSSVPPSPTPLQRRRDNGTGQDYASPVATRERIYFLARNGECYVLPLNGRFQILKVNSLAEDGGEFCGTPALSNGEMFIRSSRKLYCIAAETP